MKKFFKIFKKLLFWTFFISLFLVTTITVLIKIYEDDIEQYAVTEINKHLNTKVVVQDIDVSIFSNFPYASLDFQKILINDTYKTIESKDTLFYAKNLYLNFNIWDIWNEDYTVKNVRTKKAVLKIKTAINGEVNYLITKPTKDTTQSNFNFELSKLLVNNLRFEFSNLATQQYYYLTINDAEFNGDFSQKEYNLKTQASLYINKIKSNSFSLIKQKNAKLNLNLHIDNQNKKYTFNKGDLIIGTMPFKVTGSVFEEAIDLNIKGNNIQLIEFSETLLNNTVKSLSKYKSKGIVTFIATIKGPILKTSMPSIVANFSINDGTVKDIESNLSITNINLLGAYQNKQNNRKEQLEISKLSLQLLESKIAGTTKITDFQVPTFNGKITGNINLASFNQFFKFKGIEILKGSVNFNTQYTIKFTDIEYNPNVFDLSNTTGDLSLKNISYKAVDKPLFLKQISGDILINGNDAATKNLIIKTKKSDILLNGAIKNLIPYIEGNGSLGIVASIESNQLNINEFISKTKPEQTNNVQQFFELPNNINLNVELDVKKLLWQTHKFNQVLGKLIMANHKVSVKQFKLNTIGGSIKGNVKLDNLLQNGNIIEGKLKLKNINVSTLFADWNNFDQKTITDKNLSGTLTSTIDLLLFFDQYFNIIENKMYVNTKMDIANGELNNMQTMKEITAYMRSNKALKLMLNKHISEFDKKITNLKFNQLKNTITIKNKKIIIPKMLIKTNALDVEFSGWHDFENNIEYHFSFRFRDLKTIAQQTEFGIIEDDGLGIKIYLTMTGNIDNPIYSLDKGEIKQTIKANVTQEKETVKSILKSEFGMFKKDTTIKNIKTVNKSEAFDFIMVEEDTTDNTNNTTKHKNKKRSNKFFEKLKKQAKADNETITKDEFENE